MSSKFIGIALAGLTMSVALGGAAAPAPAVQQYYPGPGVYCIEYDACYPIAYSYEVYSDAGLTNWIGGGSDSCVQSGSMIYVSSPWLPAGHVVQSQMYVCTEMGPYLPWDW